MFEPVTVNMPSRIWEVHSIAAPKPSMALTKTTGKQSFSTLDVMLGVMIHVAHHRGQAEVYLRVKGITPPEYNW